MIDVTVTSEGMSDEFMRVQLWINKEPYGHMILVKSEADRFQKAIEEEKKEIEQIKEAVENQRKAIEVAYRALFFVSVHDITRVKCDPPEELGIKTIPVSRAAGQQGWCDISELLFRLFDMSRVRV